MTHNRNFKVDDEVYTTEFSCTYPGFTFGYGKAIAMVNKRLTGDKGNHTIIYNTPTLPGMSDDWVIDSSDQLVAIHGDGDRLKDNTQIVTDDLTKSEIGSKIGFNRGISVRCLVKNLAEVDINLGIARSISDIRAARFQAPATADEYFIVGFNKYVEPGDNVVSGKQQTIQEFSTAIRLNPRYQDAYFMRAIAYDQIRKFQQSLAGFNQAILINPKDSEAYNSRAILKYTKLNDIGG